MRSDTGTHINHKGETAMTEEELKALKVNKVVDARGTACPGPLLEARRSMADIPAGEVMEVISSDASSNQDIPLWAKKVGHEYLGTVEYAGYWGIFVKRGN
jgi:tRNA 2-thiouridine synthesizing protein A